MSHQDDMEKVLEMQSNFGEYKKKIYSGVAGFALGASFTTSVAAFLAVIYLLIGFKLAGKMDFSPGDLKFYLFVFWPLFIVLDLVTGGGE